MTNEETIKTLEANYPDACYEQLREAVDTAISALKAQQAAGDTISRCELFNRLANVQTLADAYAVIQGMPASQQEIIRCKECAHWLPHCQLGFDIDNEEYHDYCGKLIPDDEYYAFYRNADDYCSRAERRTDG